MKKRPLVTRLVSNGSGDGLRGYGGLKMTLLVTKFMVTFRFYCLPHFFFFLIQAGVWVFLHRDCDSLFFGRE